MENRKVPKRIANLIMNALQGGVVPRTGTGYIAVGREQEIAALVKDLEIIDDGGATFRFVVGNYGSGKTFLLQCIKENAISKGYIVADADLSPDRNLIGTGRKKKGLSTYRELMCNISTKTAATGGALESILDNWLDTVWQEVAKKITVQGIQGNQYIEMVSSEIKNTIMAMHGYVGGFTFAELMVLYWKAKQSNDVETKGKVLKWLRGEYRLKSEALAELGIHNIIDDDTWFDYIKLFAAFFKKIDYKGFVIMIDEMINIYKCAHPTTRQKNYEVMLRMFNDALQGKASNLGIIMGGTPRSVDDPNRGVFSYEALKSRLEEGKFKDLNVINLMTPVIRIQPLTKSDIVVLLEKINEIHTEIYDYNNIVTEEDLVGFVERIYRDENILFITPRSIIKDFINVLNILYQNEGKTLEDITTAYEYSLDVEEDVEDFDD